MRNAGRVLLAGLALAAAGVGAARLAFRLSERLSSSLDFAEATAGLPSAWAAVQGFPQIVSVPGPAAVLIGASDAVAAFSPEAFDAQFKRDGSAVTSFNLGLTSATPGVLRLEAVRLRALCRRKGKRLSVGLLQFVPSGATTAFERHDMSLKRAALMDWGDLALEAPNRPSDAARLAFIKLAGGLDSQIFTELLRRALFPRPPDPVAAAINRIVDKEESIEGKLPPHWDGVLRGESRAAGPATAREYADYLRVATSSAVMVRNLAGYVGSGDILELRFSSAAVGDFIEAAGVMGQFCDRVFIVVAPRNPAWNRPSGEALERLGAVLGRIGRETGMPILDFSRDRRFSAADFYDVIHLNETTGRPKFSRLLADAVAAAEQAQRGGKKTPFR